MADIFLICPVRDASDTVNALITAYVAGLAENGQTVHWPLRHTKQERANGALAAPAHKAGWRFRRGSHLPRQPRSDVRGRRDPCVVRSRKPRQPLRLRNVHRKPRKLVVVNENDLCSALPSAYQLMLADICRIKLPRPRIGHISDTVAAKKEAMCLLAELMRIRSRTDIELNYTPGTAGYATLGMLFAYMRDHPRRVTLSAGANIERTLQKSFNNVLHALVEHTRGGAKTFGPA